MNVLSEPSESVVGMSIVELEGDSDGLVEVKVSVGVVVVWVLDGRVEEGEVDGLVLEEFGGVELLVLLLLACLLSKLSR